MLSNIAGGAEFWCMCHGAPVPMSVKEGRTQFMACPKYFRKDDLHPDGYDPDTERACGNTLSFDEMGKVLFRYGQIVDEDMDTGIVDHTNMRFKSGRIETRILKDTGGELWIGVINERAISRARGRG